MYDLDECWVYCIFNLFSLFSNSSRSVENNLIYFLHNKFGQETKDTQFVVSVVILSLV